MALEDVEREFRRAWYVEDCILDENALLKLYGLYKQATVSDCNVKQPGIIDFHESK